MWTVNQWEILKAHIVVSPHPHHWWWIWANHIFLLNIMITVDEIPTICYTFLQLFMVHHNNCLLYIPKNSYTLTMSLLLLAVSVFLLVNVSSCAWLMGYITNKWEESDHSCFPILLIDNNIHPWCWFAIVGCIMRYLNFFVASHSHEQVQSGWYPYFYMF